MKKKYPNLDFKKTDGAFDFEYAVDFELFKNEKKSSKTCFSKNIITNNLIDEDIEKINFTNIFSFDEKITFDNWYIQMNNGGIIENYSFYK